jgi:hypothetical protein
MPFQLFLQVSSACPRSVAGLQVTIAPPSVFSNPSIYAAAKSIFDFSSNWQTYHWKRTMYHHKDVASCMRDLQLLKIWAHPVGHEPWFVK